MKYNFKSKISTAACNYLVGFRMFLVLLNIIIPRHFQFLDLIWNIHWSINKLISFVQMTAHRSFQFCKQYKRTTEFRRLCEIIRNHLANLNKYRDQRDRPDLSAPESMQLYLDTRFEQLKVATELELWQVSYLLLCLLNDCQRKMFATHLKSFFNSAGSV